MPADNKNALTEMFINQHSFDLHLTKKKKIQLAPFFAWFIFKRKEYYFHLKIWKEIEKKRMLDE